MDFDDPSPFEEAMNSPSLSKWFTTMEDEIESMTKNHVWDFVDIPPGCKTIGNKWILKVKHKADGLIDKYKACLVAKGYTQKEGVDYEETFSHVVYTYLSYPSYYSDAMDFSLVLSSIMSVFYSGLLGLGVLGCRTIILSFSA